MHIHEITLETADLAATQAFYADTLGMSLRSKSADSVSFVAGTSVLTFTQAGAGVPAAYHFAFNIPPQQIQQAHDWLSQRQPLLADENGETLIHFKSWNAKSVYFCDNNGNIVEFIARDDLAYETNEPFGIHSLMCVSEMGIVTDDPLALAAEWKAAYGLDYFNRRPPSSEFVALGDDEGLFIIVKKGRPWYPTQRRAEKQPVKVKFTAFTAAETSLIY